jgi:hypothetical protein
MSRRALLYCFVACLQAIGYLSGAAVYTVPGNYPTIQAAINSAPDGSTILVSSGTYTEDLRCLNLKKNLYIRSQNGPDFTILDGGQTRILLYVLNNADGDPFKNVTFDGFTFSRGKGETDTSPVTIADARPQFLNCKFINNRAPVKGGAALIYGTSALATFVNCSFISNQTDRVGGAVLINGGHAQAIFKNCLFGYNSNRSTAGQNDNIGGCIYYSQARGKILSCRFNGNSSAYAGGAVVLFNPFEEAITDTLEISGCVFENNFSQAIAGLPGIGAPTEAGAIHMENNVSVTLSGCYFSNNWAESGGAVGSYRGNMTVRNCVFENNHNGSLTLNNNDAGGPDQREGVLQISDTLFRNGYSPAAGGFSAQGDLSPNHRKRGAVYLKNVVIDGCSVTRSGGGLGAGGGFYFVLVTVQATNFWVIRNNAEWVGGAGVMAEDAHLYLYDSYIVGNNAGTANPGILSTDTSTVEYNNTLLAYNGGVPSANTSVLATIPPTSVKGRGWLNYLVAPYASSPSISPQIGAPPNLGNYSVGSAVATGICVDTTFTLTSSHPVKTAKTIYAPDGVTNSAYQGHMVLLPGRVEAENFDEGGESVAYHDTTTPNEGGSYRVADEVDIAADGSASNARLVGWINAGEWLEYTVYSPTTATYRMDAFVASGTATGQFYVQVDGIAVGGVVNVPNTGGWLNWQKVSAGPAVNLSIGAHVIRVVIVNGGFNFDYLNVYPEVPMLACSPARLYQTVKVGQSAFMQLFQVWNSGAHSLIYSITTNANWLSATPSTGVSTGEQDWISVRYDTHAMATGEYTAAITVNAGAVIGSPSTVDVVLLVRPNDFVQNDFDGDARSDLGVYYPPEGRWYIYKSSVGFYATQFGFMGTLPITGDFDGDGRCDFGCYYDKTGKWFIFKSSEGFYETQFGFAGTLPITGDFDGDGRCDFGCYYDKTGKWFIFKSSEGFYETQFGFAGTLPITGDFDGDGRCDFGVYYPPTGKWYMFRSRFGFYEDQFGFQGTIPLSGRAMP